ncbi:hypothetical protein [Comamonas sp. JC664]|uniref:hypothetical protein n=1 Tax=Comamonas sp. JC664 TaxID=2801917 RepID=UPI00361DB6E9
MTNSSSDTAVSPEADAAAPEPAAQAPQASQRSTMSLPVVVPALLVLGVLLLVCVLAPDAADACSRARSAGWWPVLTGSM